MKQTKIVILGAGHVGTHCALSLMFRSLANEIVLIDTDEEKAKSQALDLDDMGACLPAKVVIRSGSYEDLDDADILVTGQMSVVASRNLAAIWFSICPLKGIPFGNTTSKAEMRSVATITNFSPLMLYTSRTFP